MESKRVLGRLSLHYDGYGFVESEDRSFPDVFIPARYINNALSQDLVEVTMKPSKREGRFEGRVEGIVERHIQQLVGRVEKKGKFWVVIPDDRRIQHSFNIINHKKHGVVDGVSVIAAIIRYPGDHKGASCEVIHVFPDRGHLSAEIDVVIAKHQLEEGFPEPVIKAAQGIYSEQDESAWGDRRDFRELPFVTIDGESAKDFDDAVYVEREGSGYTLYVAIADVSHYVKPGSVIDKEAIRRSTSVYFPDRCLPMLPEALSEDLCSLRPDEDRLTMSAIIDFNKNGDVVGADFCRSVICSQSRLTYKFVARILQKEEGYRDEYPELSKRLDLMQELAGLLRKKRSARGSIDFDLPEPEIILNITEGGVDRIIKAERNEAHGVIEEFMIAANEAVARFLTDAHMGCLYRINYSPDEERVVDFLELLKHLNIKTKVHFPIQPAMLAGLLNEAKGLPEERMMNHLLLRSMAQARYSDVNIGHFGLASKCYCHFTSPIRRYPDLVIHRLMGEAFHKNRKGNRKNEKGGNLGGIADYASRRERLAMDAEREMDTLFKVFYMEKRVGEKYEGIVAHIGKFGVIVELLEIFVEGVIKSTDLPDGFKFDVKSHGFKGREKSIHVGDHLSIVVSEVSVERREILFKINS